MALALWGLPCLAGASSPRVDAPRLLAVAGARANASALAASARELRPGARRRRTMANDPVARGGRACINTTALARITFISMQHRHDRITFMTKHLARLARDVPCDRFPGQSVDVDEAQALLPEWMGEAFTRARLLGTAGCLKSKILVLKQYLARWQASGRDDELLLLLEDDHFVRSPSSLRRLLVLHLTDALTREGMACRPDVVRLDCWKDTSGRSCAAGKVTWGMQTLISLYESRVDEADCALSRLERAYCLNAGIMVRHPSYWINDIPKGKQGRAKE
ncbi:hypothetical protein KFE25_000760 [Diacronema lutheri]|uniref:Uncharacterized protein n=1 Tax=Diacronema lutheri TaxID=2081491 RepID=A0A8J5XP76_DIALT|nr:hypothetical protein KFE25_000760 [Diacronema lutheri]